eukprot:jgi/Undpi1/10278/HiC_scaffold_28.g12730.m1
MGENVRIATSEDGSGIDMANERQEEEGGAQRGHRRFLRRPKTQCVTEEKLPRRARDALVSESAVDEAVEMDNMQGKHRAKLILGVVVVAVVISAIVDLSCHENIRSWLQESFDWIESNPKAGVVVFAVIFCVATLLFVPGLILTIGAGVAFGRALGFGWGLLFGSIAVIIGAMAACIIAFYLGRYVLHEQAQRCAKRYRILSAVNTAIETNGIKVMILLRLSPLVPFSGFNLIAGLTKASLRDYMIGCLGVIPGTVAFVFIGASTAGTMNEEEAMRSEDADETACLIRMITLIVGACAAVLALVAVTIYARKALKEALVVSELESKTDSVDTSTDLESGSGEEFKNALASIRTQDQDERPRPI